MTHAAPIQFKGTSLKIIQTHLRTTDLTVLHAALADLTGNSADFFGDELAVLDFSTAESLPESIDWAALRQLLRASGLSAVATRGLSAQQAQTAADAGLPTLAEGALGRPPRGPAPPPAAPAAQPEPVAPPATRSVILDKPLRSGQRFYARGSDLVVLAMVSAGAEVIADGNIHVYAPLRGRALAGAEGDRAARIFTTSLEAELVSIAGIYRTFEAGLPAGLAQQPAKIALRDDGGQLSLSVESLALR